MRTKIFTSLRDWFVDKEDNYKMVIAFSGGVDSTVLAKAAVQSLKSPEAVMAFSPTSTREEPEQGKKLAELVGIPLRLVKTEEMSSPDFTRNDQYRCYHCKMIRFSFLLNKIREERQSDRDFRSVLLLDGTNADDGNDFRPGTRAARELGIRSPFAELGIGKKTIRELAAYWFLPNARQPSHPCLATRLAYGLEITDFRLRQIEQAESRLHYLGLRDCRVRMDKLDTARIEVPDTEISRLATDSVRISLVHDFRQLGFRYISLDLEGFESGKMNREIEVSGKE